MNHRSLVPALMCLFIGVSAPAFGFTGGKTTIPDPHPGDAVSGKISIAVFGDSVSAGYDSACMTCGVKGGGYAERFGRLLADRESKEVYIDNRAVTGFTIPSIEKIIRKNLNILKSSEFVLVNGGGNDFLGEMDSGGLCDESKLRKITDEVKATWSDTFGLVATEALAGAKLAAQTQYIPRIERYSGKICSDGMSLADRVFPYLLEYNHFVATEGPLYGVVVADMIPVMNCSDFDSDQNGLNDAEECRLEDNETLESYVARLTQLWKGSKLMDPKYRKDAQGASMDLLQGDDLHPSINGHDLLSRTLFEKILPTL